MADRVPAGSQGDMATATVATQCWTRRHCDGKFCRHCFEEWLERGYSVVSFRMTQVLTGHGKFGRFLHRIKEESTPGYRHCVDHSEDTVEYKVEVCPTRAENRRVPVEAIGGGVFSRQALVQAMVRSEEGWRAVAFFCEAVMLAKEAADSKRARERPSLRRRRDPDPSFRPP
ncbi:hypothetical protein PYW07_005789 [Mythimna separata]|uniref:Uncharacterized protein n=1 Tax=Mythimna separata TaxID=271217 RepID=A0AAD7YJJ5_MYTSE|nr:hypothetical protein PYW07_005789 [Mythimna separata]